MWLLRKFILLISGETSPAQLAAGMAFGLLLGLTPVTSAIWCCWLLLLLLFRANIAMCIVFAVVSKLITLPLDSLLISIGDKILAHESLTELWTSMWNLPFVAISGFNRPSVMGGSVLGLIFFLPVFLSGIWSIKFYRENIQAKLEKMWLIKVIKGSLLYRIYTKIIG